MSRILCRRCRICEVAKQKIMPVRKHNCIQNWKTEQSSKSMEAAAILWMAINSVPLMGFVMLWIISDDDNVMRAHLRHKKSDHKKDKGKLPIWVHEPTFMADPGHRIKSVVKHFYKLASATVGVSRVNKLMAKRLKKNWGYMIRQSKLLSIEKFIENAKAPLEHMFGNHEYCKEEWCDALKASLQNRPYKHPDGFCTRSTAEGEKMYQQLGEITWKYGNSFFLGQSTHPYHTNTNEVLNHCQACLTPKSKSFHESMSFQYRHAITVGVHNWGIRKFWTQVFDAIGIKYTQSFLDHLDRVASRRLRWKEYHGRKEVKRRRAHKQDAIEKKLMFENRTTEYASGIGLDIGSGESKSKSTKTKAKTKTKRTHCKCGASTHTTSNSKACPFNKKNLLRAAEIADENTVCSIVAAADI